MVQIDPMEYPKFSDYSSHAQSSPNIPVGSAGMVETLRTILDVLSAANPLMTPFQLRAQPPSFLLAELVLP